MSTTKHTPGPWRSEGTNIWRENGLNMEQGNLATTCGPFAEANARRIVECANACEGIADPSAVPDLLNALKKTRAALLCAEAAGIPVDEELAQLDAAIAKATGNTL